MLIFVYLCGVFNHTTMKRILFFGPGLLVTILIGILWLVQIPDTVSMPYVFNGDKMIHAFMFGILATVVYQDAKRARLAIWKRYLIAGLWTVIWGGGLELIQKYYTTYRHCSWWDWVADLIGITVALLVIRVWQKK